MIEKQEGGVRVTVPMLIANAAALQKAGADFLAALPEASKLVIDLAAVDEADSSALSVIFSWLRTARERRIEMQISCPPASMVSLAGLYGVSDSLPLA